MDKIDVSAFIFRKIKDGTCFTIQGVIDHYHMDWYYPKELLNGVNKEDSRTIISAAIDWKNTRYVVDEFGGVTDHNSKPCPIYQQKINGISFDVIRKRVDGKQKFVTVATLMLKALKKAKNPRSVKHIKNMPEMPTLLSNLTYIETKQPEPTVTKSMTKFIFSSQLELDGLLWTYDISSLSGLAKHLNLPINEINLDVYRVNRVKEMPIIAEYSDPVEIDGVDFRFNRFGGVMTFKYACWDRYHTPFCEKGKMRISYTNSSGVSRTMNIANKMISVFGGPDYNVRVHHIDKNPYNLIYRNLWHKNNGERRYFR